MQCRRIAYSTTATSDSISVLAADNVNSTISEIKDMVNYDVEAKRVLQAYIDSGFGNVLASDFFGKFVNKTKTLQEETAQGKIEAETYINENTENVEDENYEQELGGIQENFESDKQNEQVLRTSGTDGAGRTDTRTEGESGTAEEGNVGRTSQNTSNAEERIRNTKNNVYQYNEVDFDIASENARAVVKEVERLGLPAYIYEGDIYINGVLFADKEGNSKHPQGKSCDGEFILIKNNTEVPWRELSAHEISHAYETLNLKEAVAYLDAVKNNFIISSDAGSKIIEKIYENNYNNIYGEIAAQISGWLHDDIDVNELSDVLINVDEVVDTHKKFIAAVTVKEETEDVHEGVVGREIIDDDAVQQSKSVQKAEEERNTGTENRDLSNNVSAESGAYVQVPEGTPLAERPDNSGSDDNGIRKPDDSTGNGRVGTERNDSVNEVKSKDFNITKAVAKELDTSNPNFDGNITARRRWYN